MAQKVSVTLVSDLTGGEADETVSFALDGKSYEFDATSKEADKFRGLFQDYISVARKVSGSRASTRKSSGSGRSKEELHEMREWLRANGHDVSDRGRISQELQDLYDAR